MIEYKVGEILTVIVLGSQPYGLFVRPENDDKVTGLIHISEISYDFVKDVAKVAEVGEKITAKILDYDKNTLHLKLSMKALQNRTRFKTKIHGQRKNKVDEKELIDFTPLEKKLTEWVNEALKREKEEI